MTFSKPLLHIWYVITYFGENIWYGKHQGIDLRTKNKHFPTGIGQPLYAPAKGKITKQAYSELAGNMLYLDHGNGFVSRFYHLENYVKPLNAFVEEGELIAHCGNTGEWTTGSHLHWEIRLNGVPVNPILYLEEEKDILNDMFKNEDALREWLKKERYVQRPIPLNIDHKDGSVWWVDNGKRYKIGTNADDIAIFAALFAAEPLSDVERNYPITTTRKDVM